MARYAQHFIVGIDTTMLAKIMLRNAGVESVSRDRVLALEQAKIASRNK